MNIDKMLEEIIGKENDISRLKETIKDSAKDVVIMFVDISGSTSLKETMELKDWLLYIYKFINIISDHAMKTNGIVIKRIGDEVMLSFERAEDTERFIDSIYTDLNLLNHFQFKIGIDYGTAYYLKFENKEVAIDDPYGITIDRCARIVNIAETGVICCSASYVSQIENKSSYISLGNFKLKGISEPQEIFVRNEDTKIDKQEYFKSIIERLNSEELTHQGYRFVTRTFTPDYFKYDERSRARPFLLRELLKVPTLPYTMLQFAKKFRSLSKEERFDYCGYLVDWKGLFSNYSKHMYDDLQVVLTTPEEGIDMIALLQISGFMIDIVKTIQPKTSIRFRGLIQNIDSLYITLNYIDFVILG
jgi:class 3 adenylate cyclase